MKKMYVILSVIAVIVVASIALVVYQKTSTNSAVKDAVSTDQVNIKDYAFTPKAITVKAGTTVTWTNHDGVKHELTSYDGHLPAGREFANGETYTYTFTKAGTYKYHCKIHPNMTGVVVVTN